MLNVLGYQIATSLFLQGETDSSVMVTYPYRALMLLLALMLIVSNPIKTKTIKYNRAVNVFLAFFIIYFLRIIIDLFFRDVYVHPIWRQTTIQLILFSVLPSMWATIRCAQYVDYDRLNKWLICCSVVTLILLLFNQSQGTLLLVGDEESTRMKANVAMDSLSLGYTGCTLFFISLVWFLYHKNKFVWNSLLIVMMGGAFIIMIRAASRGPLIAFVVMLLMVLYSSKKNKSLAAIISILAITIIWLNIDVILYYIGELSPIMGQLMSATAYEGDSSGRNLLYANAIDVFLRNPIFGEKFVLDIGFYSHNSLLDVLMALGLVGGLVWLYLMIKDLLVTSYHFLHHSSLMIIGLLSVNEIVKNLFSGTIYTNDNMIVLMAIVLLLQKSPVMTTTTATSSS